jgi:hypothetical protein
MIAAKVDLKVINGYIERLTLAGRAKVYAQAAREAANPVRNELRRAWRKAKRRSGKITRKIAAAQEVRVFVSQRRSANRGKGVATVMVGTNYKRGGSVKLWHLLERGYQHYGGGSNSVYTPRDARARDTEKREDAHAQAAGEIQIAREVMLGTEGTKYSRQRVAQQRHQARMDFRRMNPIDTLHRRLAWASKQSAMKSARGGVIANRKRILGRHISEPIARLAKAKLPAIAAQHAQRLAWYQIDGRKGGAAKPKFSNADWWQQ